MNTLSVVEVRKNLSDVINQAAYGGEHTVIERHGKPIAAVVSIEDLEAMQALEDQLDLEEIKRRRGEKRYTHEEVLTWLREEDHKHKN